MGDGSNEGPPARYRILDLTEGGVNWAGRLLADLGADVIKVEPPDGSATRGRGPFAGDKPHLEKSLFWLAYCANKRGVSLDIASAKGRGAFLRLVATADVLVESFPPGHMARLGLGHEELQRVNSRLIAVSVSPFGRDGPYAGYKATDLTLWSMGGATFLAGDLDRPPVRVAMHQAELHAGAQAAAGVMAALWHRERTGRGQRIDVSMQEAVEWTTFNAWAFPPMQGVNYVRGTNMRGAAKITEACKDGHVNVAIAGGAAYGNSTGYLVRWMVEEGFAPKAMLVRDWRSWDTWAVQETRGPERQEFEEARELARRFLKTKAKAELFERAVRDGIMLAPCNTARDILESPHLAKRGFWAALDTGGKPARFPGPWMRLSATPLSLRRRAPRLGEHNREVLGPLAARKTRRPATSRTPGDATFAGLRILDLSWVAVGPITTRYFADYGATVIRVESAARPDVSRMIVPFKDGKPGINRGAFSANWNANKLGLGLNLAKPEAREVVKRLVREWGPDVLVESFSPGTMAQWGLDYASARRLRPDIIYLSTSQLGQSGPHAGFKGYGVHASAIAGFDYLTGWPDRMPEGPYGAYTDFVNPPLAAVAVIAALMHRQRTGRGQYLDQSQVECALQYLAPTLLDCDVNGRIAKRQGNADSDYAPHGVYPCKEKTTYQGGGSWVAIAVTTAEEWKSLTRAIGRIDLADDPALATAAGRRAGAAGIDAAIAAWTQGYDRHEAMRLLQAAGVPAGAAQKASDLWEDPQLAHHRHFRWLQHPECGAMPYVATQFRLSGSPGSLRTPGPMIGQHNALVLGDFLGMTGDEIANLAAEGVVDAS
ncbi:MAG: CoA transferase [Chloroflexi bacterium]|nr:CoA transferase [Chloroflexota bacterium]